MMIINTSIEFIKTKMSKLKFSYRQIIYAVLIIFYACSCNRNENRSIHTLEEEKNILRKLKETEWPYAYQKQDTIVLDRILGEDFQKIDAEGNWSDKRFEMNWIKKNKMKTDSFFFEIKRLDVLENETAIIAGTGHITIGTEKKIYQSTNILVKRNGIWKAVSSHVSGIKTIKKD